jgi:two-component system chemotaxis response regulator CheY
MNILLVDDSRTMRSLQRRALIPLGEVTFTEAGDGIEALAAVKAAPAGFTLMLVDWNMPNMDGLTFVTKLREFEKKALVVMVTTEGEKERVLAAVRAGANGYVLKPFAAEALLEKVQATLAKAKAA